MQERTYLTCVAVCRLAMCRLECDATAAHMRHILSTMQRQSGLTKAAVGYGGTLTCCSSMSRSVLQAVNRLGGSICEADTDAI